MTVEDYLINVLSAVIAIEYMDHGFPKKYSGGLRLFWFLTGCGVYFLVVTKINMITEFESVTGFLYGVVVACYGLAALKGKPGDILLYGILWMVIVLIGTYAVYGVVGLMTGKDLQELVVSQWGFRYYASLSAAALKFSMGRIVSGICRKKGTTGRVEDWMMASAFLVMFFLVHGMFSLEFGAANQKIRYYLTTGLMIGMFGLILLLELCYQRLWKYHEENMRLSYKKNLEIRQQESLENLYRMVRDVNRIRHDMNGRLDVLYYLLKKQHYEEVQSYIKEMHSVMTHYPELPKETGNTGLNAALIKAAQECREKGIRFHSSILGSPDKIDSMDMGVLLYNLFNNGIEACMEIQPEKERRLELVLMERKNETELQLLNSIGHSVLLDNPNLRSRKKDSEYHGFGMDSIYRIIKKYHGEYGCREEEDCFIQMITLEHLR